MAHGSTIDDILQEYEEVAPEDTLACFLFATGALGSNTLVPLTNEVT